MLGVGWLGPGGTPSNPRSAGGTPLNAPRGGPAGSSLATGTPMSISPQTSVTIPTGGPPNPSRINQQQYGSQAGSGSTNIVVQQKLLASQLQEAQPTDLGKGRAKSAKLSTITKRPLTPKFEQQAYEASTVRDGPAWSAQRVQQIADRTDIYGGKVPTVIKGASVADKEDAYWYNFMQVSHTAPGKTIVPEAFFEWVQRKIDNEWARAIIDFKISQIDMTNEASQLYWKQVEPYAFKMKLDGIASELEAQRRMQMLKATGINDLNDLWYLYNLSRNTSQHMYWDQSRYMVEPRAPDFISERINQMATGPTGRLVINGENLYNQPIIPTDSAPEQEGMDYTGQEYAGNVDTEDIPVDKSQATSDMRSWANRQTANNSGIPRLDAEGNYVNAQSRNAGYNNSQNQAGTQQGILFTLPT